MELGRPLLARLVLPLATRGIQHGLDGGSERRLRQPRSKLLIAELMASPSREQGSSGDGRGGRAGSRTGRSSRRHQPPRRRAPLRPSSLGNSSC